MSGKRLIESFHLRRRPQTCISANPRTPNPIEPSDTLYEDKRTFVVFQRGGGGWGVGGWTIVAGARLVGGGQGGVGGGWGGGGGGGRGAGILNP